MSEQVTHKCDGPDCDSNAVLAKITVENMQVPDVTPMEVELCERCFKIFRSVWRKTVREQVDLKHVTSENS